MIGQEVKRAIDHKAKEDANDIVMELLDRGYSVYDLEYYLRAYINYLKIEKDNLEV